MWEDTLFSLVVLFLAYFFAVRMFSWLDHGAVVSGIEARITTATTTVTQTVTVTEIVVPTEHAVVWVMDI